MAPSSLIDVRKLPNRITFQNWLRTSIGISALKITSLVNIDKRMNKSEWRDECTLMNEVQWMAVQWWMTPWMSEALGWPRRGWRRGWRTLRCACCPAVHYATRSCTAQPGKTHIIITVIQTQVTCFKIFNYELSVYYINHAISLELNAFSGSGNVWKLIFSHKGGDSMLCCVPSLYPFFIYLLGGSKCPYILIGEITRNNKRNLHWI